MKKKGPTLDVAVEKARALRQELTGAEQRLWEALRDRRLNGLKFRRQHPYGQFVLDFFCAESLLAVEVDGAFHDAPDRAAHDAARTEFLTQRGVRVLRFTNDEIEGNMAQALGCIAAAAHTPHPLPPLPAPQPRRQHKRR